MIRQSAAYGFLKPLQEVAADEKQAQSHTTAVSGMVR